MAKRKILVIDDDADLWKITRITSTGCALITMKFPQRETVIPRSRQRKRTIPI